MYKNFIGGLISIVLFSIGLCSCGLTKKIYGISEIEVPLIVWNQSAPKTYKNLDKDIRVVVKSSVSPDNMFDNSNLNTLTRSALPQYIFTHSVKDFAQEATVSYMQQMRFNVAPEAECTLIIDVGTFRLSWINRNTVEASVKLRYRLTNEAGETEIPLSTVSSNITLAKSEQFGIGLGRAYAQALRQIKWDGIADYLQDGESVQHKKQEKVNGSGNTVLEHSVIRWNIESRPSGADVYWRIISSTPDVQNTNSSYVGNTPYESTESFDIKGMNYNNSGNIQIEISCEKSGYLTQRKRFNLRQAIDQKEISAMFNLVKEEK